MFALLGLFCYQAQSQTLIFESYFIVTPEGEDGYSFAEWVHDGQPSVVIIGNTKYTILKQSEVYDG